MDMIDAYVYVYVYIYIKIYMRQSNNDLLFTADAAITCMV